MNAHGTVAPDPSSVTRHGAGLTREGRDTLWLLSVLAMVMAPHVMHVPAWASVAATLALGWRARLAWTDAPLPRRGVMALLLFAATVATWVSHGTLIGRAPGITLVVMLATLKCLELRARRDALVCLHLGFFLILTQFLFSQSIGTALLMLLGVWGLLTSLVLGQRPLGRPPLREALTEAAQAMVKGLPLMLVLFLLFPRLGPLWSLPSDARSRIGLSDTVRLGDLSSLAADDSVALRVSFQKPVDDPEGLYFRGPTLDHFDGRDWTSSLWLAREQPARPTGAGVHFQMTIEPSDLEVLPLPQTSFAVQWVQGGRNPQVQSVGPQWLMQGMRQQRVVVEGQWLLRSARGLDTPVEVLAQWTRLPRQLNPRTVAWARARLQALPDASPAQRATDVLDHIRRQPYRYTLSPPPPGPDTGLDVIDDFWMDQRAGFCEHYASAFVVIMRAQGIPARMVTGYLGAELNPIDGQYMVRNSSAHAWTEIWLAGRGWVTVDPTLAVAPERTQRLQLAPLLPALPGAFGQVDAGFLRPLRFAADAVNHRWNSWVLQYSGESQMSLLRQAGWPEPDWKDLGTALAWVMGLSTLAGGLWISLRDRRQRSPWPRRLARRRHAQLASLGLGAPAGPQPADASAWRAWLSRIDGTEGTDTGASAMAEVQAALRALDELRYGPDSQSGSPWERAWREWRHSLELERACRQVRRTRQAQANS